MPYANPCPTNLQRSAEWSSLQTHGFSALNILQLTGSKKIFARWIGWFDSCILSSSLVISLPSLWSWDRIRPWLHFVQTNLQLPPSGMAREVFWRIFRTPLSFAPCPAGKLMDRRIFAKLKPPRFTELEYWPKSMFWTSFERVQVKANVWSTNVWGQRWCTAMAKTCPRLQNHLLEHQRRPVGHEYVQDDLPFIHHQLLETYEWKLSLAGLMFHSSFVWKLSTEPKAWSRVIEALKCQTGRNWMDVGRVGREVCLGSSKVSNIHLWFPMFLCPGCGNLLDGRIKIVTLMALGTNAGVLA